MFGSRGGGGARDAASDKDAQPEAARPRQARRTGRELVEAELEDEASEHGLINTERWTLGLVLDGGEERGARCGAGDDGGAAKQSALEYSRVL